MFCSTVIPTVGRSTLSRAVYSVLDQTFTADDFEVIVVNDSGQPLPEADWQHSDRVRLINTQRRERSVARNVGAAMTRGKYLHFLDDDDWLLPNALLHFWKLAQSSRASWLYGGYNFVDTAGNILEEWHPDEEGNCLIRLIASEWLPMQASLVENQAFFAVGGFEPAAVPFEDNILAKQIALREDITGTTALVVSIVRSDLASTTDYSQLQSKNHWIRERILNAPTSFSRMRKSATSRPVNSSYWQGRITAAYLGSVKWNLRRKRFFTAFSGTVYGLGNVAFSSWRVFSPSFWRGATRPHVTRGFLCRFGV